MRGVFSGAAQIVGITGNARTKVPGPDAIDNDPSAEWVVGIGDPVGQRQPTFAFAGRKDWGCHFAHVFRNAQRTRTHGRSPIEGTATRQDRILFQISRTPGLLWQLKTVSDMLALDGMAGVYRKCDRTCFVQFPTMPADVLVHACP